MKVLIAVASKHGATFEIGQVIEASLTSSGLEVELQRIEEVSSLSPYDALVLGSGVYAGHWMRPAREFVEIQRNSIGLVASTIRDLVARGVPLAQALEVGEWPLPTEVLADAVRRGYEQLPPGRTQLPLA